MNVGLIEIALPIAGAALFLAGRFTAPRRAAPQSRTAELEAFQASRRDPLTQLANRALFLEKLAARLRERAPSALLLIDIDRFSAVCARDGSRQADEVLREVADRLRQLMPGKDAAARLGSDEFALLVETPRGLADAEAAALNVIRALTLPLAASAGTGTVSLTVSLGVALLPCHGANADGAMQAAGAALAHVKEAGGATWRFYDPDRGEAMRQRAALAEELRAGIEQNQILPFYQPIIDLSDNRVVGLEVLARWVHPTRGILPPDLFIPLAEEMQLAGRITQLLMRRVIADAREWPPWLYFAFNVAPSQLRELIGMVRNPPIWPEGSMDPKRVEVEITESALIEDLEVAREVIALLQARGTRVVLDDFGIGFSNFFHLRELPFDRIKIDRSFILEIETDPRAQACVGAMLALANSLGIPMVAEGVETERVARRVASMGCQFGQGFWFSHPLPGREVRKAFFSEEKKQKNFSLQSSPSRART